MLNSLIGLKDNIFFVNPEYLYWGLLGFLSALSVMIFLIRKMNQPELSYGSKRPFIGKIKFFGFFAVIIFLFSMIALARPFANGAYIPTRGSIELIFVVDNSGSMLVKDIGTFEGRKLARIDAAAKEILDLYSENVIREGDRVGVFTFGLSALIKVYPTKDRQRSVNEISKIGMPAYLSGDTTYWGSNPALVLEHIYQSLDRFDRGDNESKNWVPKPKPNRLVILFSDGDFDYLQSADDPQEGQEDKEYEKRLTAALQEFRKRQWRIYSVGIGSQAETNLNSIFKDYKRGEYDEKLPEELKDKTTRFRSDGLEYITRQTGGKTPIMTIHNAGSSITDDLAKIIDSPLHRSVTEISKEQEKQEFWRYALYMALFILFLGIVFY